MVWKLTLVAVKQTTLLFGLQNGEVPPHVLLPERMEHWLDLQPTVKCLATKFEIHPSVMYLPVWKLEWVAVEPPPVPAKVAMHLQDQEIQKKVEEVAAGLPVRCSHSDASEIGIALDN